MALRSITRRTLWTPERITTALWLDAADSSTITTVSGAVSQWSDKSGNGRNATQSTASARPVQTSNALNGYPAVTFDGTDDLLTINSSFLSSTTLTIACVAKENNGGFGGIVTGKTGPSDDNAPALNINSARRYEFDPGNILPITSTTAGSNWNVVIGQSLSSSSFLIALNGTIEDSSSSSFTPASLASTTVLGTYRVNDTTFGAFDLGELVVTTVDSTLEKRQRLEGYLAHKWGLTANLGSGHPYENFPPRGL